ncbi:hypothetical protein [Hydrogenophaga sp. NFH-34]|uniref:hypothetical protein n=1 Tax=Hydrogenophaga sp. NFH-34 TaxID=2744446 RepID=UPI001F333E83|nr:hypothetical protein [Hydrogenophaga sp. NFH-34]
MSDQKTFEAAVAYVSAYGLMMAAMKNGINVHGAMGQMIAAEDGLREQLLPQRLDLPEHRTQHWYDQAWKHGAVQHKTHAGDDLQAISFTPDSFESFCMELNSNEVGTGTAGYPRLTEPSFVVDDVKLWDEQSVQAYVDAVRRHRSATSLEMDEAVAAGDGTLHGAIDHWQTQAIMAEPVITLIADEAIVALQEVPIVGQIFDQQHSDHHTQAIKSLQESKIKGIECGTLTPKPDTWLRSGSLVYRLTDELRPQNCDEVNVTMAGGSRHEPERREDLARKIQAYLNTSEKFASHS